MDALLATIVIAAALFGLVWFFLMLGFSRGQPARSRPGEDRLAAVIAGGVVVIVVGTALIGAFATQEAVILAGLLMVVGVLYLAKRGRNRG